MYHIKYLECQIKFYVATSSQRYISKQIYKSSFIFFSEPKHVYAIIVITSNTKFTRLAYSPMSEYNLYKLPFFNVDNDEEFRSYLAGAIEIEKNQPDSIQNRIPGITAMIQSIFNIDEFNHVEKEL